MTGRRAAVIALVLAGCGVPLAAETRYRGTLEGCGAPMPATLVRDGTTFVFTPGDGVLVIQGTVAADGSLAGSLNTQPPGKPAFLLSVRGRLDPEMATLDYATPRCRASGRLTAAPVSVLP